MGTEPDHKLPLSDWFERQLGGKGTETQLIIITETNMKPKLELNLIATTYGGPEFYHPAIRDRDHNIWYWPNMTFPTEAEAYERAVYALKALVTEHLSQMQTTINEWNIHQP